MVSYLIPGTASYFVRLKKYLETIDALNDGPCRVSPLELQNLLGALLFDGTKLMEELTAGCSTS